jgi:hypothetical protein
MRRAACAVLLAAVSSVACLGYQYLLNDTGETAYGLRVVFSEPVEITGYGDALTEVMPTGIADVFEFSGGEVEAWIGGHWFTWSPATVSVVEYEWLTQIHRRISEERAEPLLAVGGAARDIPGDLLLTGSQRELIENETVRVHGSVILRDRASLIVRNAIVEIVQSYHEEYGIELEGRAKLQSENASFVSAYTFLLELWGSSSLVMADTMADRCIVTMADSGQAEIRDSSISMLAAEPTVVRFTPQHGLATAVIERSSVHHVGLAISGAAELTITGVVSSQVAATYGLQASATSSFSMTQEQYTRGTAPYRIVVDDCDVSVFGFVVGGHAKVTFEDCILDTLGVYDSARVTMNDSHVDRIVLRLGRPEPLNVSFGGLRTGWHEGWALTASRGNLPCSLTLNHTQVFTGWYLRLNGGQYHVFDSVIQRFRDEFDTPESRYHVENCCVHEWMLWYNRGTVVFENSIIDRILAPDDSSVTVRGAFCVREPTLGMMWGPWRNRATITRWFPVQVYDDNGSPLGGVEVHLKDPAGRIAHRGLTNAGGLLDPGFKILFNEANHEQRWTVSVPATGQSQTVGLLSSTPITLPQQHYTPPTVENCYAASRAPSHPVQTMYGTAWGSEDGTITPMEPLVPGQAVRFAIVVKNPVYVGATGRPDTVRFAVRFRRGSEQLGMAIEGFRTYEKIVWLEVFEEVSIQVVECEDGWCGEVSVTLVEGIESVQVIGPRVTDTVTFGLEI